MPEATYLAVRGQFWFLMLLSHEKILIMPFTYMQALRELFQQYGPVTNIYHPPWKEGTGYVTMASPAHATVRMPGLHSVAATLVLPVSCVHAGCMTHCVLPAWHGRMSCLCAPRKFFVRSKLYACIVTLNQPWRPRALRQAGVLCSGPCRPR